MPLAIHRFTGFQSMFHVTQEFDLDFILKYATHFQSVILKKSIHLITLETYDAPTVLSTNPTSLDRLHKASSVTFGSWKVH